MSAIGAIMQNISAALPFLSVTVSDIMPSDFAMTILFEIPNIRRNKNHIPADTSTAVTLAENS